MIPLFCLDLTFEWYENVMVFCVLIFIFLFRTNGKKVYLDENDSGILKVTWSQIWLKFVLNNYRAFWQQHFGRYSAIEYFTDMDQYSAKSYFKTLVNIMKQISMKVSGKKLVAKKSELTLRRKLHQNWPRLTNFICFSFSQTYFLNLT